MFKIVAVFAVLALAKAVPMGRATGKLDTTGVDAPDETVKAFSKGLFESCAAVREAGVCSHPMAAKHCAATCDAAKKLVAGTEVSADKGGTINVCGISCVDGCHVADVWRCKCGTSRCKCGGPGAGFICDSRCVVGLRAGCSGAGTSCCENDLRASDPPRQS